MWAYVTIKGQVMVAVLADISVFHWHAELVRTLSGFVER